MATAVVQRITIYPLIIPLRRKVTHAAAERGVADPVVVAVELSNGRIGYGETVPRPYVTGETVDSVVEALQDVLVPALLNFHPDSFPAALEAIESLPWRSVDGRPIPAARAAVDLALLDAAMRTFDRDIDSVVTWMGLPGFGRPGSVEQVRFGGVLSAGELDETLGQLRLMYWGGLRHFKLKVGLPADHLCVRSVASYLARPIARGKATLRIDANGAWTKDDAIEWLGEESHLPLTAVEQPLGRGDEDDLPILHDLFDLPLIHDESLISLEDARQLVDLGVADVFNIRISKCGGLLPSLRLAAFARRSDVRIQLGCMVGETSILSSAGIRFLQVCPTVSWAEGCYGSFLLRSDVVRKGLRFGYAGRPPKLRTNGLVVDVDEERLWDLCEDQPIVINL